MLLVLVAAIGLAALGARATDGFDMNQNFCFQNGLPVDCEGFAYALQWYDVQRGDLKLGSTLKFMAKVTRLPSPPLAEGEPVPAEDSEQQIQEAFVLVCRQGALECTPAHQFTALGFLLHKIFVDGPFDFARIEEGVDAVAYKLKSVEFASPVAERIQIVFCLKLGTAGNRHVVIKLDREVVNGDTVAVRRANTALCTFAGRFQLQIDRAPKAEGLRFSAAEGEAVDQYRIRIAQYGDGRVLDSKGLLGDSLTRDKEFHAGNVAGFALPFVDRDLAFAGPNSILGREVVLLEQGVVVGRCLPLVHTVLAEEEDEDGEEAEKEEGLVPNSQSLVCEFKDSGSVVVLERIGALGVLMRYTVSALLHALRHVKSDTTLLPSSNPTATGSVYLAHVSWQLLEIGTTLSLAGEKCVLGRMEPSASDQLEFADVGLLASEPAMTTTASCTFARLGQLVFYRGNANRTRVRMDYAFGFPNTSSVQVEFHRYGVAISESNPVSFAWPVPATPSPSTSTSQVRTGSRVWEKVDLDLLVGRLVKVTATGGEGAPQEDFCLVRRDALSAYFERTRPRFATAVRAAHCLVRPLVASVPGVALWLKQVGANEQIQAKLVLSPSTTPSVAPALALYTLHPTTGLIDRKLLDLPANASTTEPIDMTIVGFTSHLDELYGLDLALYAQDSPLLLGSCTMATVEIPATLSPTSPGEKRKTLRPSPSAAATGDKEEEEMDTSVIPLTLLAVLGTLGCCCYAGTRRSQRYTAAADDEQEGLEWNDRGEVDEEEDDDDDDEADLQGDDDEDEDLQRDDATSLPQARPKERGF